jgi:CHAT domain-containing protein
MSLPRKRDLERVVPTLSLALLATVGCIALGCRRPPNPQNAFDQAQGAFLRGELRVAEAEARSARERYAGHYPQWGWRFRLLDAEAVIAQGGRSDEALVLLSTPLPRELTNSDVAIRRQILQASAYIPLDKLEEANRCLSAAEALDRSLGFPLSGEIARARGALERRRNDLEGAERFFRRSLRLAKEGHDARLELTDLINLSAVAEQLEHYDESIAWSNAADTKAHNLGDMQLAELVEGNLGWAYYKLGDFGRALALSQAAEKEANRLGAAYHRVLWLNNVGLVYYQLNEYPAAEDYYRRSLGLAEKNKNSAQIIDALTSLAFVSVQSGQLTEAQQYSEQAFQLAAARKDRGSQLPPILVEGIVAAQRGQSEQAAKLLGEVIAAPESDLSLRWEAQNNLAKLYELENRLPEADQQYRAALATIEKARSSLQHEEFRLPFLANAAHLYDDCLRFLVKQGKIRPALQLADYSRARTLAEGLGIAAQQSPAAPETLDPQQVARQKKATILFYWLGRDCSYLWAIKADQVKLYSLPPAAEIDAAVQRYHQALLGWQDVLQTVNPDGRYLYDVLVAPTKQWIAPNSRVIVITDGTLDSLNFETLLAPEPKLHYWVEDATVLSASSLRVLSVASTHSRMGTGKLLLMGNAVASSADYAPLPNASSEMENVKKHFPADSRVTYDGDKATPAAYLSSNLEKVSFIHFVAHASASKLSPLDSAIILSRSSQEEDSFKLYARDITHHPLNASLVTISSCYGAGAKAYSGEGLVGLSWAFLRAGAHNVIGALWEVNDASTATLMDHVYDGLKQGQPPEAALRSAKLAFLHSGGVVRKPFYWAPFQLYSGR